MSGSRPSSSWRFIQRDKLIVVTAFLLAIAAAIGFHLLPDGSAGPVEDMPGPLKPSSAGEFRGIALQLHNNDPNVSYERYVRQIASTGANTISLVVAAYQENCSSTSIFIDMRKTPSMPRLRALIDLAHQQGLRVVLMPIVLLENARKDEWRGKIAPTNWDDWWKDYRSYIMHYTYLAESAGVDLLIVGSELVSTESQTDRWRELIALVRKHYHGRISYSANWDHYRPIKWWSDVDVIGMQCYHDLTGGKQPTVGRMVDSWKPIKSEILKWRKKINRPVLFTEAGWPNQVTCGQYPWDYYRSTGKPDPQAQANCFEAFFRTWVGEKDVAGYITWEWKNNPKHDTSPRKDTSYVLCDKPALGIIRKYFQSPAAMTTTTPSTKPDESKSPPPARGR